jgi:hypothetical protein
VAVIVKAAIVFGAVLILMPHEPSKAGEAAPVSGVLASLQTAMLTDISQVRADIAQSQRERGGSLFSRI